MVNSKKLLLAVAQINAKYGHATQKQTEFLYRETHGHPLNANRQERRIARAKMRDEMFHSSEKQEFTVPELESKAA